MMRRIVASLVLVLGFGIAGGGAVLLWRTGATAGPVATGYRARSGAEPSRAEIGWALAALDRRSGADPAAARLFLRYALANRAPDRLEWRRQLLAALDDGREALAASPGRADVSLALAEIEFLLFGPGQSVYDPLRLSFMTAPRELWIIDRRIGLGLKLIPSAPADLREDIASDIRVLGEPFRDPHNYWILARAAALASPDAVAVVRAQLSRGHPWPRQLFEQYFAELSAGQPHQ